jgi:HSP20 family protein
MSLIPWRNKQHQGESTENAPLASLRNEIDRLFDAFVREPLGALDWPFGSQGRWSPALDMAENDQEVTVRAELPGIEPGELDVSISGNQLVLSGEKKQSNEHHGKDFYHSESRYGSFRRSVQLPDGVDAQSADAEYANGVLTLRLKKSPAAQAKRIEVKVKQ